MKAKRATTFRLEQVFLDAIDSLAGHMKCSRSEVVRRAVTFLRDERLIERIEPGAFRRPVPFHTFLNEDDFAVMAEDRDEEWLEWETTLADGLDGEDTA